jgi:hypothetical protein
VFGNNSRGGSGEGPRPEIFLAFYGFVVFVALAIVVVLIVLLWRF